MNLQGRLEVQNTVRQWIAGLMQQYEIPPSVIIDAINKVMVDLKDELINELFAEAAQAAEISRQNEQQMQNEPYGHDHFEAPQEPSFVVEDGENNGTDATNS